MVCDQALSFQKKKSEIGTHSLKKWNKFLKNMGITIRSHIIIEEIDMTVPYVYRAEHVVLGETVSSLQYAGTHCPPPPHTHMYSTCLLAHSDECFRVLLDYPKKKATLIHYRSQLSWLYQPHERLAAFEFCTGTVTHLLKLPCILMML